MTQTYGKGLMITFSAHLRYEARKDCKPSATSCTNFAMTSLEQKKCLLKDPSKPVGASWGKVSLEHITELWRNSGKKLLPMSIFVLSKAGYEQKKRHEGGRAEKYSSGTHLGSTNQNRARVIGEMFFVKRLKVSRTRLTRIQREQFTNRLFRGYYGRLEPSMHSICHCLEHPRSKTDNRQLGRMACCTRCWKSASVQGTQRTVALRMAWKKMLTHSNWCIAERIYTLNVAKAAALTNLLTYIILRFPLCFEI